MKKKRRTPEILNCGSLMTYKDKDTARCFGYMFHFPGHGVYEPTFGRVEVSPEEAQIHNRLLSEAEVKGLDENCAVGMGGMFYTKTDNGRRIVVTWLGDEVSRELRIAGQVLTFERKGMRFRGRLRRDEGAFFFTRVS